MKKPLVLLSLLALALSACTRFKTGDGGLQYAIHTDKDGPTIQEGDFIVIKATQKTEKDSVLFSTEDIGRPQFLVAQKSQFKGDWYTAFAMLSEGDSATFKINLDTLALKTSQPKPPFAKDDHFLIFTVKIEKVIPKGKLDDQTFTNKITEYIKKDADAVKKAEPAKVKAYVASKGLKLTTTASGLGYQITKLATGEKAVAGDSVVVNYVGKFLSDKVFDTNIASEAKKANKFISGRPYEPMRTVVGMQKSLPGFDEALMLFPVGTKVTVVIPSALAYGEQGYQNILPYTPLVFDLEILKVIKAPAAPAVAQKSY
jgi:FKBP-type peptidyl-prolyl cis-trans isomerase